MRVGSWPPLVLCRSSKLAVTSGSSHYRRVWIMSGKCRDIGTEESGAYHACCILSRLRNEVAGGGCNCVMTLSEILGAYPQPYQFSMYALV